MSQLGVLVRCIIVRPVVLFALLASCSAGPAHTGAKPAPPLPTVVWMPPLAAAPSAAPSSEATAEAVVEAPPKPEPPYDLAADIEARKTKLKGELGDKTQFVLVDDVFLFVAPDGIFVGGPPIAKQAIAAYFNGRFEKRPERALTVLVFDAEKPYEAYCEKTWKAGCGTPFGFYRADIRTLVMNLGPGVGTLTHELVHPIVEADFPDAPDWINEGLGSLYEAYSMPGPGEIRGMANFRLPGLRRALKDDDAAGVTLPKLFAMSNGVFRDDDESLHYAMARYFCMWMERQKKLWPFYRAWRDGYQDDKTGEKAFARAMGHTPKEMNEEWTSWVQSPQVF